MADSSNADSSDSDSSMADSSNADMKERVKKLLSEFVTNISELGAKIMEQREENTQLARELQECLEKYRVSQEKLKIAEEKLAQFSDETQMTAQESSAQVSFPLVVKDENSDDKYNSNVKHLSKRKKLDEGTGGNNIKTRKSTSILKDDLQKVSIVEVSNGSITSESSSSEYLALKDEGNALYSAGDFLGAVQKYSKSLELCTDSKADRTTLLKNRAAAYLKLQEYEKAIEDTTAALKIIPRDIKALYRRCQAYEQLGKYDEALEDARAVNCLNPKNSAIQPYLRRLQELVKDSNDEALNINSMPEEILLKIFGYLLHNDLGRTAQVCTRWNALSRNPDLWKKVSVDFNRYRGSQNFMAECLINILPPRVTSLRLNFWKWDHWIDLLNFEEICMKLQERCPILKGLMLENAKMSINLPSIIDTCTMLLPNLRRLALHSAIFPNCPSEEEEEVCCETCKIKVLDLYGCYITHYNKPPLERMPYLKKLYLACTDVDDSWFEDETYFLKQLHELDLRDTDISSMTFQTLQIHAPNLRELYLCDTGVNLYDEEDLNFNIFRHLKTICLRHNGVSCEGIVSLIKACKSLQNIYVEGYVAYSYEMHPFVKYNECKLEIVKDDCCSYKESRNFI